MNEEKNNNELNYNFDFESQVNNNNTKESEETVEVLDDETLEDKPVLNNLDTANIVDSKNKVNTVDDNIEILEENADEQKEEVKDNNVKKIKILNKEFNYEDVILVAMGIIILVSIFLLPTIMRIFK